MCNDLNEPASAQPQWTKAELRRQRRFEELQTLYNLAAGAYGSTLQDPEMAKRVMAEMEKLILNTPFAGGAN
jgi:hypothetical protein